VNHNTWMTRWLRALLCATSMALAACGGGGDAPPPPMIGAAGGTVSGPNGAQVVVPAGALGANTAIAVAQSSSGAPALPAGVNALGSMFAFTPHGTTFAAPVTVTVPFDAAALPAGATPLLYKTNAAGAWEQVANASVNAGTISAQVTSFSWVIIGNLPPQITAQPADAAVVEPATASFGVTALGTPPFTYQWQKSDDAGGTFNDIAGAITNTYTTGATSVAADDGDRYRVLVSNLEGTSISAAAMLTVTANVIAPTIATQPQNASVAVGADATFTVVAAGTSPAYQWQRSNDGGTTWADITGATNASYTLSSAQAGDHNAQFRARASNGAGTVVSNAATLTVTTSPPTTVAARIAAGSDFSLARRANGDLYSWGSDSAGTLGAGNGDQTRSVPGLVLASNITGVAAGGAHGMAVRGTGEVRGWGYDMFGQLGDGGGPSQEAPVSATVDAAGTMQFSDAVDVCGGSLHSLVLRSGGAVHAMGSNSQGQLGDGSNTDRPRSVPVSGITNAIAIACRGNHSLALLADGTVRAWGINTAGQLGDGTTANRNTPVVVPGLGNVIAIAAGSDHSLALRSDGSVWAWGSNVNGKLGDGTETNRTTPTATLLTSQITAIAAGYMNSLARRSDGIVLSWGINETGQLGSGSLSPGFRPQPAPVAGLTDVVAIAMGTSGLSHALAVRSDGTVWSWGDNGSGKLGNGSTAPFSATPVQVTGLNLN
jgi:alpha-tubulin suppressor-like RCC1 family protein